MPRFTETQRKILDVLSDGMPHTKDELHACLSDELAALSAVDFHLTGIRKVIRPVGQDIICQFIDKQFKYRLIIVYAPADE